MARAVARNHRVAAKGGHGTGKTQEAAKIALWFLHAFAPAIVVDTAPGREQVRNEMWREIRKQASQSKVKLFGGIMPKEPFWHVSDDCYMQGIATDAGGKFRGKHGPNMLFIFNEATDVPAWAFEEAENMCTAPNNKILLLGNPIKPQGLFFDAFREKDKIWTKVTLNCLDHPNVLRGEDIIPGAVSRKWVMDRIAKLCTPIEKVEDRKPMDFEFPKGSGQWYRPSPVFQARVLGEFPDDSPDCLIPLSLVIAARNNRLDLDETAPIDIGVDVSYKGVDHTVIFARQGMSVLSRRRWQGKDPTKTSKEVGIMIKDFTAKGYRVGTVAVDAIGIGAGVASNLRDMKDENIIECSRILSIQVSEAAVDSKRFANKRAEMAFALAERFQQMRIDLTRLGDDATEFEEQATQINIGYQTGSLRYLLESKDQIREKIGVSPDDFDAMFLAFTDTVDTFAEDYGSLITT
jgi:phage terminase large subunit